MVKAIFRRRGVKIVIVRQTLAEVLDVLRGWCPGGKLREVFEAAGRVQ